jgi:hypothetical protein
MNLAAIVKAYHQRFELKYADCITLPMQKAMHAVLACRTEHYGQITLCCPQC